MLSEHDSILDAQSLIEWIPQRFTSAQSRFIWYGSREGLGKAAKDPRIIVHPDEIPSERIWSFSHMAMSFSPDNPEYGRHGRSHICTPEAKSPPTQPAAGAKWTMAPGATSAAARSVPV